jgi:hypothetical protein
MVGFELIFARRRQGRLLVGAHRLRNRTNRLGRRIWIVFRA